MKVEPGVWCRDPGSARRAFCDVHCIEFADYSLLVRANFIEMEKRFVWAGDFNFAPPTEEYRCVFIEPDVDLATACEAAHTLLALQAKPQGSSIGRFRTTQPNPQNLERIRTE